MNSRDFEFDHLSLRLRDLERENKVLSGALVNAGAKVVELQSRLERLETTAHPLAARLSRALQPS